MFKRVRSLALVPAVALLAVVGSVPTWAQSSAGADAKEISSYKLTAAGLARYTQASHKLAEIARSGGAACEDDDGDEDARTIDQAVAKLNATPGAAAALKASGMMPREFIVFSMAVFQAGMASWALTQPGGKLPPGMSMDNVNFYRQHEAELAKLGKEPAACDEE